MNSGMARYTITVLILDFRVLSGEQAQDTSLNLVLAVHVLVPRISRSFDTSTSNIPSQNVSYSIIKLLFIGTRTGIYAINVFSDVVITSGGVAAERKTCS